MLLLSLNPNFNLRLHYINIPLWHASAYRTGTTKLEQILCFERWTDKGTPLRVSYRLDIVMYCRKWVTTTLHSILTTSIAFSANVLSQQCEPRIWQQLGETCKHHPRKAITMSTHWQTSEEGELKYRCRGMNYNLSLDCVLDWLL